MDDHTFNAALSVARDYDEMVSIGGGEPTLHPNFWNILQRCLGSFDFVWMATNGSRTQTMFRLSNIIDGEDYPKDDEEGICQDGKLSVALSQDCFHDPIDQRVIDLWTRRANQHRPTNYEIRNVTRSNSGVIAEGRAKRTGAGWSEGCICPDMVIKPDGKIRLCGCTKSPVIGDVWHGIEEKWLAIIQDDDGYRDTNCYKELKKGVKYDA
jgi:MoaA/NifB/PqqE/SkfB family radical SAM enzyme